MVAIAAAKLRGPRYAREPVRGWRGRKAEPGAVPSGVARLQQPRETLMQLGDLSYADRALRWPAAGGRSGAVGVSHSPQVMVSNDRPFRPGSPAIAGLIGTSGFAAASSETAEQVR